MKKFLFFLTIMLLVSCGSTKEEEIINKTLSIEDVPKSEENSDDGKKRNLRFEAPRLNRFQYLQGRSILVEKLMSF
mgnify:CR=1 FL=1